MTPEKVYERFWKEFPHMGTQVVRYFRRNTSSAKYSIRIMLKNGRSLIFSIKDDDTWILKTK